MSPRTSAILSVYGTSQNEIIRQFEVTYKYINWRYTQESYKNRESFLIIV